MVTELTYVSTKLLNPVHSLAKFRVTA